MFQVIDKKQFISLLAIPALYVGLAAGTGAAPAGADNSGHDKTPTCPAGSPADTRAADAPDPAIVALLDRLEQRGKQLQSLQADFVYQRTQGLLGDVQVRTGRLVYASQPRRRFAIHFEKRIVGNGLRDDRQHYVFDGDWLVEKNFTNKMFIKRQVVPPGKRFDPLAIGQGPFPMPLGQEREKVVQMFDLAQPPVGQGLDEKTLSRLPDKLIRLRLIPKTDPNTGKPVVDFTCIDLWYDAETLLPALVRTADASENQTEVRLNRPVVDQLQPEQARQWFDTTTPPPGTGWHVEIKPWQDNPAGSGQADRPPGR